ncbi:MAG: hypothetical protein AB1714_23875 [Acidobacteriota bacterium]
MKRILIIHALLLGYVASAHAAEYYYVPLIRQEADGTWDLYWMKLNESGKRVKGPRLIRNSAGIVGSATITPEGNKVYFSESPAPLVAQQLYSLEVNPKNGKVASAPVALTGGSYVYLHGVSLSKDGKKLVYARWDYDYTPAAIDDILLQRFKKNGSLSTVTKAIATVPGVNEWLPFITEDGRSVYYCLEDGGKNSIMLQRVKRLGAPAGPPIPVIQIPGEDVRQPMVEAGGTWMSYIRYAAWDDNNLYVTRLSGNGLPTGAPIKITSLGADQWPAGGLTRNSKLLVYSVLSPAPTCPVYSQKLDANGHPAGAPKLLNSSSCTQYPWVLPD